MYVHSVYVKSVTSVRAYLSSLFASLEALCLFDIAGILKFVLM
jgi:hypothetical protein